MYFVLFYILLSFFEHSLYRLEVFLDGKVRIGRVSFELIRSGQDVSELKVS